VKSRDDTIEGLVDEGGVRPSWILDGISVGVIKLRIDPGIEGRSREVCFRISTSPAAPTPGTPLRQIGITQIASPRIANIRRAMSTGS
jgi:hypothetical protein